MKRFLRHVIRFKYLYTLIAFFIWLAFFDQDRLIYQFKMRKTLQTLEKQQEYYESEILKNKELFEKLTTDTNFMERHAREKYLLKKDDEVIYLIVEED